MRFVDHAIIGTTPDGVVTTWSQGAALLYGFGPDDIVGRPVDELVRPEHQPAERDIRRRLLGGEFSESAEPRIVECRRRDGSTVVVSVVSWPVLDGSGVPVGIASVSVDVSRPDQGVPDWEKALSTVRHDLRTPVSAILGFTAILLAEMPGPLNAEQQRQLQLVHTCGERLLTLINESLDPVAITSNNQP